MTEHIYLQGSEQISIAGTQIAQAAHRIEQAVNHFEEVMQQQQRFMNEYLERLAAILRETR